MRRRARRRGSGSGRVGRWPIVAVVALAITLTGVLIQVGNQATPPIADTGVAAAGNTLGPASAPVQVEEWGDFQ